MNDQKLAEKYMKEHKKAFECWREGYIKEIWRDEDGYLCVRYESGTWFHYKISERYGTLEWW